MNIKNRATILNQYIVSLRAKPQAKRSNLLEKSFYSRLLRRLPRFAGEASGAPRNDTIRAQVLLEFTFCMIIVMLMIFGAVMIFRWSGVDLAERRRSHEETLMRGDFNPNYGDISEGPMRQIDPYFYKPVKMNAIWGQE